MYSNCKAIIFDMGGVLVKDYSKPMFKDIADAFNTPFDKVKQTAEFLLPKLRQGKITVSDFFISLAGELNRPLPSDFNELFTRSYKGELIQSTYDLSHKLREKYKVALLSNTIKPHVDVHKAKGHFDDYDAVFLSCEVGLSKPQLGIWQLAAKELGVKEEECIYIDDYVHFVTAAESLGMHTVHRQSEEQINEFLMSLL